MEVKMFYLIPLPKTRKGAIILLAILSVAFIVTTFYIYSQWTKDQQELKENGKPHFNTITMDKLKNGLIVQGTIDMAFDVYAETYDTRLGIRTSSDSENLYYVVPIYDVDKDGVITFNYCMTFKADTKHFDNMEKILEQTWSDVADYTEIRIENGLIQDLSGDYKQFFYEWAEETDFYEGGTFIDWCVEYNVFNTTDKEIIKSKLVPYMIKETYTAGTNIEIAWFMLGLAVLSLIMLLVLIFRKKPIKGLDDPDEPQIREFKYK